jgi:uncharacterized RDD family membrane protein YckC
MATFGKRTRSAAALPPPPAFGKRAAGAPLMIVKSTAVQPLTSKTVRSEPVKLVAQETRRPVSTPAPAELARAPEQQPESPKPHRAPQDVAADSGFGKPVWARRVAARLVDELGVWLIIFLVFHDSLMASLATYASVTPGSGAETAALVDLFEYVLVFMIAQSVYNIAMEGSRHQATLGKMLAGVVVTDRYGGPPRLRGVILRNTFGRFAANILPFCSGYAMGLFNKERRCVHDMVANTVVRRRLPRSLSAGFGEVFA